MVSFLCGLLSIIVIWSELVFWIDVNGEDGLSIFSILVMESKKNQSFTVVVIFF